MAAVIDWSEELENKLIDLWREKPCLFDTSCKLFSNRTSKRAALEELAFQLEKPADDVMKRMRSLRTQLSRINKAPSSGSSGKSLTGRQEWLTKCLDFLRPHLKNRESTSSYQVSPSHSDVDSEEELEDLRSATPIPAASTSKQNGNPGPGQRQSRKRNKNQLEILESIAASISKPLEFPSIEEKADSNDVFGQYVSSRLREIHNPRIKAQLIFKINQAISEAEFASLDQLDFQGPSYYNL